MKGLTIFLLIILLGGCNSENAVECFKSRGEIIEVEIYPEPFHTIETEDEIDIYLSNGNLHCYLKGGKNVLSDMKVEVSGGVMKISNSNSCNWVREAGNPEIHIQADAIRQIFLFDFANLYTRQEYVTDSLLISNEGTGDVDINLKSEFLLLESFFIGNHRLKGIVNHFNVKFSNDSRLVANELKAGTIEMTHLGSNDMWLYPVDTLEGIITQNGHLYLYNEPNYRNLTIESAGKVFEMYGN